MLTGFKGYIQAYLIILLLVLSIRSFLNCKGGFEAQLIMGTELGTFALAIIGISNI